jgi:N6-adenosine-specific RNA methylase IME4
MQRLDMQSIMARDCAVFMWACMPTLPEALDLGMAWGLTYKTTAFTWVKRNRVANTFFVGLGYWTRANAELCLLFTRGKPKRKSKRVQQIIYAPVGRHSAKPEAAYQRIEALIDGPYCEVFARNTRPGWDAIGNEIDGRDIRDVVANRVDQLSIGI